MFSEVALILRKRLIHLYFIAFLAIFAAVQLFFLRYMTNSGLDLELMNLPKTDLSFPILVLPTLGALLFMISCWDYAVRRHYQRYAESALAGRSVHYRVIAKSSLLLFVYTLFLLAPLVVTSGWAVDTLSLLTKTFPQLKSLAFSLLQSTYPFVEFAPVLRFSTVQLLGLTFVALSAFALGRKR